MDLVRFTKTDSKFDKVEFARDGAVLTAIQNPKQGIIPHDLIHLIVERKLGLRGFTQMVFEGQLDPYTMVPDGEAWLSEAMVESIQGMLWSGNFDCGQFNEWIQSICEQRAVEWRPVEPEVIFELELELEIEDLGRTWKAIAVGESLEVPWPKLGSSNF
jgi:hypothetical protein